MKANDYPAWDWPAVVVLVLAVFTAAVRLDATSWTPDLGYVESTAVFGTILGAALGVRNFKISRIRWLAFFYSVFLLPLHLSRIIHGEETALGKLLSLAGRVSAACMLLFGKKPIEDHIFFVVTMAILFWVIGFYSGYRLMRGRDVFWVILLPTLAMLIIQYYDGYTLERIWGVGFYFFLVLMLAGRINLLNSRDRWADDGVVVGSDPEFDLNKYIVGFAAAIILLTWLLPAPAGVWPAAARFWKEINRPFESFQKRMDDVFAALDSNKAIQNVGVLYAEKMNLGRAAASGEKELFRVILPQSRHLREYWRARVYDAYQNGVWQLHASQNINFDPDEGSYVLLDVSPAAVEEYTFSWQIGQAATLVTPLLPVWVSRKGFVQTMVYPDAKTDLLTWNVDPALESGDQYIVRSMISNPTQKELRESGSEYPEWMKNRYLQVPAGIAVEYKRLAEKITAGLPTNFDKAEAITHYLRENITYSESISAAPPGVDPLVWFLFGWKSGYCNYYASAEVMLLRSVGIPARMAVGYSQGKSLGDGLYSVRARDAHAWPEVYFPSAGWVQFEPTTSQAVLVRPSGEMIAEDQRGGDAVDHYAEPGAEFRVDGGEEGMQDGAEVLGPVLWGGILHRWLIGITVFIVLCILILVVWRLQKKQSFARRLPRAIKYVFDYYNINNPTWMTNWLKWSEASAVERAFDSVNTALAWFHHRQPGHITPSERAVLLSKLLPEASDEIDILSHSLEQALFTPENVDLSGVLQARRRLLIFLIKKIIRRRLPVNAGD